jgi:G3E family GTPase
MSLPPPLLLPCCQSQTPLQDLSAVGSSSPTPAAGTAAAAAAAASPADAAAVPEAALSGSHRHIAELLLEQIEVADVLLLNKADTVSGEELQLLQVGGSGVLGSRGSVHCSY